MPTGNFNGFGMAGWGMPYAPQMQRPMQRPMPMQGGNMPAMPYGTPPMGGQIPSQAFGGGQPAFGMPQLPFQASPVAMDAAMGQQGMNARFPGNDREPGMNRFGSYARRFTP